MKYKKIFFIFLTVVLLAGTIYSNAFAKRTPVNQESVIWDISKPKVLNEGQVIVTDEGTLITGYVIQARARAKHNNIVPDGLVTFTLTAFSPNKEMPGQIPGMWYVQGDWVITKKNAAKISTETRHSPDKAEGKIKAQLIFNPFETPMDWSGLAWVPMSPTAGRWSFGEGSITFNGKFEGKLVLELTRLSDLE